MLSWYPVPSCGGRVCVTDEPDLARKQMKNGPVIGYVGEDPGTLDGWSGVFYLIMDLEVLTPRYLELVWCRYYHLPLVIARTEDGILRELKEEDAPVLCRFYKEGGGDFLEEIPGEVRGEGAAGVQAERLRIAAYIRHVYPVRGFGMYVLEQEGRVIGMAGFEMEEIAGESRIVMGYYVAPDKRRQGIARRICRLLLDYGKKEYEMEAVYLRVKKENQASIALAAKLGFKRWMPDSKPTDSDLLFRILPAWK